MVFSIYCHKYLNSIREFGVKSKFREDLLLNKSYAYNINIV